MNQGSNFPCEAGPTGKVTFILNALQRYLRHILSALKHPWQASRNIFQVSTLAPSPMSQAHHSALRHGGSSLLTWFLSLFLPPAADLLSPQLDQLQETVLRAGSPHGVKSFLFSQQPKLEGGRWERKHFKLTFLQETFPVRWERLPGTGKGLEGFAKWHIHTFGDLATRPDFLPSLGCSQSKEKWSYMESSLVRELYCCLWKLKKAPLKGDIMFQDVLSKWNFVCHASRIHHLFEGVADLILPHSIPSLYPSSA